MIDFIKLQCFLLIWFIAPLVSAQNLTIPPKNYVDSIQLENSVSRINSRYPLSDQGNKKHWKLLKKYSDEFNSKTLNEDKWYPNNPKWKGRAPTYFHASNVSLENDELVIRINKHGSEKLPEDYTHSTGFIKSKQKFLYGYFEAEAKLMDAPWVSGFWMTNVDKDWWTEIDICENAPGVTYNRHDLNSNIHVFRSPKDQGDIKKHFSRTKKYFFPEELQNDYHVWGLEWTKDIIRFYIDGILFREAKNTHWHQPLEINFNCESNKWFGALPDNNKLDGAYHVKYFRVWEEKNKS
ncbi:family 16 glycosylhydrolase [Tamlana sp. 2_MG-2023]|uniref:family 16 glycosylhydrolase n=1 Tax=unclassified Tamlana TaxID=2614803 RepID=UPI0026E16AE3|nr:MULTISPECIES: family 16 glycosylhydrolase [unclassified Tamlana]MDO6761250.1 family 16 glycosylhydrolase [Tamlana sp. 2_MG-2023]MDO6791733.1 family 16 glycosylhydrolase [Tamlana sp. 1_MG-2023]